MHNHIIFNSVSDRDGHKYHSSPTSYFREIRGLSDALCREYGLSVIGEPERHALTYVEWRMKKLSIRTQRQLVDRDVAECLSLAMDVGGFYALMEDRGYTVQHRSRCPTFVPYGEEQGHRARVKGKAMTGDDLFAYIDRAMTDPAFEVILPRQQRVHFPRGKVTGFRACVLAWMYILGLANDGVQMQHIVPPGELKRFKHPDDDIRANAALHRHIAARIADLPVSRIISHGDANLTPCRSHDIGLDRNGKKLVDARLVLCYRPHDTTKPEFLLASQVGQQQPEIKQVRLVPFAFYRPLQVLEYPVKGGILTLTIFDILEAP